MERGERRNDEQKKKEDYGQSLLRLFTTMFVRMTLGVFTQPAFTQTYIQRRYISDAEWGNQPLPIGSRKKVGRMREQYEKSDNNILDNHTCLIDPHNFAADQLDLLSKTLILQILGFISVWVWLPCNQTVHNTLAMLRPFDRLRAMHFAY
ncbi:hypothetical protein BDD12DRAFT_171924 [Trichophaea hybrida]|nr:hypothetical protein BDD12DRAFT_171924 [Trichophaea hybrida]